MKANTKSLHAKLYQMTYDSDLPSNLCPYFWKLVLAVIFFIPNFIMQIPSRIQNIIEKDECRTLGEHRLCGCFLYGFILFLIHFFYVTYHLIRAMMNCYYYDSKVANVGLVYWVTIALVLIGFLVHYLYKRTKNKSEEIKEEHPSIVIEFVKAKYNKY